MKKQVIHSILFLIIGLSVFSCKTPPRYPAEPAISYLRAEQYETVDILGQKGRNLKLIFHVIDGDGDIGSNDNIDNDMFLTLYKNENGQMVIDTAASKLYKYRIPYATPLGQDKTLDASISVDINFPYNLNQQLAYDTIQFEFYILDRAGHQSNTEKTPKIAL